jgi:hypothetical protein
MATTLVHPEILDWLRERAELNENGDGNRYKQAAENLVARLPEFAVTLITDQWLRWHLDQEGKQVIDGRVVFIELPLDKHDEMKAEAEIRRMVRFLLMLRGVREAPSIAW